MVTGLCALLVVTACHDPESPATVVSIDVFPNLHTYYELGDELDLVAVARDESHQPVPVESVTWVSSDPSVVDVDAAGVATAVAAGSATITARTGDVAGTAELTVDHWAAIAAGNRHTCALTVSGSAFCWGQNNDGELGSPLFEPVVPAPVPVAGDLRFRQIMAGKRITCAVSTNGEGYCWGLSVETSGLNSFTPRRVADGFSLRQIATMISVGSRGRHVCGVTTDGAAICWGTNDYGQLGDNSTVDRDTPVEVLGGLEFDAVSTGDAHSCGIARSGDGYCWGAGAGSGSAQDSVPGLLGGNLQYATLASMFQHSCALTPAGVAYCWGAGVFGKLGDGSDYGSFSPVPVSGGLVFSTIDVGGHHTCGVTTDGQAHCWGANGSSGYLGTGDTVSTTVPVPVAGSLTFVTVSAGGSHSCGITATGAIYCWGYGATGALGNGGTSDSRSPFRVRDPM